MARHDSTDAVLDKILIESFQARARELAEWMTLQLGTPVYRPSLLDSWPADAVEAFRSARDVLRLAGGLTDV